QENQSQAVAREEQKRKRQRIHERHIADVQLPAESRAVVKIPSEWKAGARGGEFTDKGGDPGQEKEDRVPLFSHEPGGSGQGDGEKNKNVGTEDERLAEKGQELHQ